MSSFEITLQGMFRERIQGTWEQIVTMCLSIFCPWGIERRLRQISRAKGTTVTVLKDYRTNEWL